jgi:hypothetical protein
VLKGSTSASEAVKLCNLQQLENMLGGDVSTKRSKSSKKFRVKTYFKIIKLEVNWPDL